MEENMNLPEPTKLYNEEQTRILLGGIGKSKLAEYIRKGVLTPIRRRPSLFTGQEIIESMQRIVEYNKSKVSPKLAEYGIE